VLWQFVDERCLPQLAALRQALRADEHAVVQNTHVVLAEALQVLGAECECDQVIAIRRAICAPAVPGIALFPGARDLLESIRDFGMRCVVLSNVQVRGTDEYRRDFAAYPGPGSPATIVCSSVPMPATSNRTRSPTWGHLCRSTEQL